GAMHFTTDIDAHVMLSKFSGSSELITLRDMETQKGHVQSKIGLWFNPLVMSKSTTGPLDDLNRYSHLGKFDGKAVKGFFVSTNEVNAVGAKTSIELPDDPNMPDIGYILWMSRVAFSYMVRLKRKSNVLSTLGFGSSCLYLIVEEDRFKTCLSGKRTKFEKMMQKKFQMSSMGKLTFFLGPKHTYEKSQKLYAHDEDVYACARYQVNRKISHLHAVKRIFRIERVGENKNRKREMCGIKTEQRVLNGIGVNTGNSKLMLLGVNLLLLGKVNAARHKLTAAEESINLLLLLKVNAVRHNLKLLVNVNAVEVNPTIYTSCIEQFWATVKVKTVNGEVQLQALVDGKKIIVTEASVRRDLQLNDEEGTDCLPNATIFEELTRMGYEKLSQKLTFYKAFFSPQWKFLIHTILQCLSAKTTAWNEFSSTMASAIICLATNQKFNFSKYIFESMVKNLDNAGKFLMYPRFVQVFLDKQLEGMSSHKRIYVTPSHTKKIFGNMKRVGKGFSGRETPLFPTMVVQNQAEMGEGSAIPTDPHHTPTIIQPSTSQPQKKQRSRRPKRKDTEVPQPSGPTTNVADEAVYEERDDSLERAATTATGLDAEQDRGNIDKTQSKVTPNEPSSLGTSSGGGPRRQETIGDTIA
ncbi:hypothetical protein Tco_0201839, partial [Tanacetum coccineum]